MKKSIVIFCLFILLCSLFTCNTCASVYTSFWPIDENGNDLHAVCLDLYIDTCMDIDGNVFNLELKENTSSTILYELDENIQIQILENANEDDFIVILNLCSPDGSNPYPEIEPLNVKIGIEERIGGSRTYLMGTDFRLYSFDGDETYEIEITEMSIKKVSFTSEKLGCYVLYYNPRVYSVDFFEDEIEYDENRNIVNEVYFTATNLAQFDSLYFPEIPEKEGYVFTGWKQNKRKGAYYTYCYIESKKDLLLDEWKIYPCDVRNIYASWCSEDEYSPLEVVIESEITIKKGKEDGCEIILTLSEGMFDETIDEDIENDWKIVGSDELLISSVERIDNTTAKLTLSGNSSDKFTKGEIKVEFNSELYISHEGFGDNWDIHEIADIQLDENGIKRKMFISDNSIILEKQKKSGNSGGVEKHTVTFETNGGEELPSVRVANGHTLKVPERVLKEGFVFAGWYTDEELTEKYDFTSPVTKGFTLYAAWEKPTAKEQNSKQIFFPIKIIEEAIEFVKSVIR